jgi:gliding motility-associated-like protein
VAAARAVPFQPNIFRFNNATGELSNPVALPLPNFVWSWEFSPNSRYFYISQRVNPPATTCNILRYDLQAPSIPASVSTIGTVNNLASDMQLAPDGKIYFCTFEFLAPFSSTINRINCPNTANPTLETNLFTYSNTVPCIGLPTFPAWLFDNDDDTFVSLGPDSLRLCDVGGEIVLDAQNPDASYVWSNGSTSQTITVTEPGTYSVAVAGSCGNGNAQIVILPCDICVTSSSSLTETACESYTSPWGTVYNQSGVYTDTLSTAAGCDSIITLNLTVNPPLALEALPESVSIALGDTVQLSAIGASSYVWSPTEGLSCSNCASPLASPQESTIYTVTGTDSLGCTKTDTLRIEVDIICNEVFIPTIFSPNGKGPQANETFCVFSDCVEQFKLVIHNRWGEKVFETEDISQCWDGTYKGVEATTGVYAFNVYLKQLDGTLVNKIGNISLVR